MRLELELMFLEKMIKRFGIRAAINICSTRPTNNPLATPLGVGTHSLGNHGLGNPVNRIFQKVSFESFTHFKDPDHLNGSGSERP